MPPNTANNTANGDHFPLSHLRSTLDSQFSFNSERSFCDELPSPVADTSNLQAVVADEAWFQVRCVVRCTGLDWTVLLDCPHAICGQRRAR